MGLGGFVSAQARDEYFAAYESAFTALPPVAERFDVETAFGTARVYRFGAPGPSPMVLLHGRAGATVMWQPNLQAFVDRNGPVYSVDVIGEAGRSVQTAPIRDGADQAAWLSTVLAELALEDVHLVGYSFGGWLAANYAVHEPSRLASLTLIEPVQTFARFTAGLIARSALAVLPVVRRWGRPAFISWISDGAEVDVDDPVARVIEEGMRTFRIGLPTPRVFTDAQLWDLRVPALVLLGGRSVMHDGRKAVERARRLLVDAQCELWPSATHSIAGESAAAVNARVLAFLSSVERRGRE